MTSYIHATVAHVRDLSTVRVLAVDHERDASPVLGVCLVDCIVTPFGVVPVRAYARGGRIDEAAACRAVAGVSR